MPMTNKLKLGGLHGAVPVLQKVRVVCVGASITAGATTANPVTDSYPAQLGSMLGNNYNVINYGVSGCTMHLNIEKNQVDLIYDKKDTTLLVPLFETKKVIALFGRSPYFSADVAPMNVRDIKIICDGKLIRKWELSKHNDRFCFDEIEGATASALFPSWLIDDHIRWKKIYSERTPDRMIPITGTLLALSAWIYVSGNTGVPFSAVESFYCPVEYFGIVGKDTNAHHSTDHRCIPVSVRFGEEVFDRGIKDCENHLSKLFDIFECPI